MVISAPHRPSQFLQCHIVKDELSIKLISDYFQLTVVVSIPLGGSVLTYRRSSSIFRSFSWSIVDKIVNLSWDQRSQGATSRDKQSRHSAILAVRMQFMTITKDAGYLMFMSRSKINMHVD